MHEAHPQTSDLRLPDLKPEVQSYIAQLKKSLFVIYTKYEVKNRNELAVKVREGIVDQNDSDRAIDLLRTINECGKQNEFVYREFEKQLIEQEKQKLAEFFGRPIEVPPLPNEITEERMVEWMEKRLELHYLPPIDMSKEKNLKNWAKPDFKSIENFDLFKGVLVLQGCWILIDGREKPKFDTKKGNQAYEDDDDFLGPVVKNLRSRGLIERNTSEPGSRFCVEPRELEHSEVVEGLAKAMGLAPEKVSLPRMIEFNLIGNIYHPEWGQQPSDCFEWFSDRSDDGRFCLNGCSSRLGGFAFVRSLDTRNTSIETGFRPMGRFK